MSQIQVGIKVANATEQRQSQVLICLSRSVTTSCVRGDQDLEESTSGTLMFCIKDVHCGEQGRAMSQACPVERWPLYQELTTEEKKQNNSLVVRTPLQNDYI